MKLSIIIPVYNEKDTILDIINRVNNINLPGIKKEIIIVDDFSEDGTKDILKNLDGYKIIFHKNNLGKGSAIRTGLNHITGDIVIIQDADMEYNPDEYSKLLKPVLEKRAKVVYGSRYKSLEQSNRKLLIIHYLGNKFLTFITNLIYNAHLTDMETCYKLLTKEVIENIKLSLKAKRFDFEPEITAKILKKGYKIYEVPISYNPRNFSEGKKINWKDGFIALWILLKYRFFD